MALLDSILNAQNGQAISSLAQQFGLSPEQTEGALKQLVPALGAGISRNVQSPGGLDALSRALDDGAHDQYLDDPTALSSDAARANGDAILGQFFGSKDVSRQVAAQAAMSTGIDASVLKQMLPLVASMVMGTMSKQSGSLGLSPGQTVNPNSAGSLLSFLDANKDGSIVDDLLRMAGNIFGGPKH